MKDLFSQQSQDYALHRPTYPQALFDHILSFVHDKDQAWDCATGNGQAAAVLAEYFKKVQASDISEAQISHAKRKSNIEYHLCPAEQTPFADNSFDLITVATAYHWLDWKRFRQEATRVGKNGAVIAIWGYHLITATGEGSEAINQLIVRFYRDIVGSYWDPERRYIDDRYATVEFDYEPLPSPSFPLDLAWTREQFTGYLRSWSAVQHYIDRNGSSPIALIEGELDRTWPAGERRNVRFPVFLRMGRISK